jgi:hypothetical protein
VPICLQQRLANKGSTRAVDPHRVQRLEVHHAVAVQFRQAGHLHEGRKGRPLLLPAYPKSQKENDISLFYTPLLTRIIAYRNEFIFQEVWKRLPISDRDEFLEDLNSIEHDLMDSVRQHLPSFTITLSSAPFRSRPSTDRPSNWQFLSIRDSPKSHKFKRKS